MASKTDAELMVIAEKAISKRKAKESAPDFDFKAVFKDKEYIDLANSLLNKYLSDFNIETQADRSTLMQLIQLEVIHKMLFEKLVRTVDGTSKVQSQNLKLVHDNMEQQRKLKTDLGVSGSQEGSVYNYIQQLIKRGTVWAETLNKADRTFFCQHCSQPNLLLFKIDQYFPIKHPFFQGRYITNHKLIELYLEKKLTEKDIAEIFDVAKIDYMKWIISKFYTKEHLDKIKETQSKHYNRKFSDGKEENPEEETTEPSTEV
jgi:hypothetical protein